MFFSDGQRFKKYLVSILIGLPTWYVIGVLVTFSDQFGREFAIEGIAPGKAIMFAYAGISLGDVSIGFVSQWLRSRKPKCGVIIKANLNHRRCNSICANQIPAK